jgi:transposase InsO family protein
MSWRVKRLIEPGKPWQNGVAESFNGKPNLDGTVQRCGRREGSGSRRSGYPLHHQLMLPRLLS